MATVGVYRLMSAASDHIRLFIGAERADYNYKTVS